MFESVPPLAAVAMPHRTHSIVMSASPLPKSSAGCMVSGDAAACGDVDLIEKRDGGFFRLMYAAAHCHAPACMSIELWNDDTGELICRNVPIYGNRCGCLVLGFCSRAPRLISS